MTSVRQALALATLDRYAGLVLSFVTMAAVSRILTPAEVGVAAIGWVILSIPYALRDLGTTDYIVQRKELSPPEVRTAATICLLAACLLTSLVLLLAPHVAAGYGDPRIAQFLGVMVFAVLTDAIGAPLVGLMRRDMAIDKVAIVNVGLAVVSTVATIGLALAGLSYMSVAWAGLIGNTAAAMLAIYLRPQLGVFRPSLAHWRDVLRSGAYFSTMAAIMRAYEAMPYLALGRFMPAAAIGYYNRATQICQLPEKFIMAGVASVAFPAWAAEARNGEPLKPSYLRAIELITGVQWPALLMLVMLAPRIVQILLGEQWSDVVPLVQIMALASLLGAAASMTYPVLYAIGDLRNAMLSTLLSLPVSALVMIAAARFGAVALAASLFITVPLNNAVALHYIRRHLAFSWSELWTSVRGSLIVALLAVAGPVVVVAVDDDMSFDQSLPVQGLMLLLAAAGWLAGLRLTSHPLLAELRTLAGEVRARLRSDRKGEAPAEAR